MKNALTIFFVIFLNFNSLAQKIATAYRINEKITVDAEADEKAWENIPFVDGFTQIKPKPGEKASQNTKVKIAYDDHSLYVFAICEDNVENISKILSLRDDFNANTDYLKIVIDTYNDDQNGFVFGVSSVGVQYDAKVYADLESPELNMAWYSAVIQKENGWQLEMKIPYSAFRFTKKDVQDWGINFYRHISRLREESAWSPIKPDFENFVAQCGSLKGVEGIIPPVRLAFMPYVSSYANHFPLSAKASENWSYSYNAGMDIKYGLNEAFTLDMTLVPDFGQVQFDNLILNLSPFEVQFNENRQFFTEGTELFTKAELFYSRRVGIQQPPQIIGTNLNSNEFLKNEPNPAQLYNASKISGRNKTGLGIGLFNAISAPQYGIAVDTSDFSEREIITSPLTNYNVLVLDQNLPNNSYLTFTNTNVTRIGNYYNANVSGLNTKINNKDNKYFSSGEFTLSQKYADSTDLGYNFGLSTGKQTGNFIYSTSYFQESDAYDPNDLGFNLNNNKRIVSSALGYRKFKPFWKLNSMWSSLEVSYNRLYAPNVYTATYANGDVIFTNRKFHTAALRFDGSVTESFDYFEPRNETGKWDYYFVRPVWCTMGGWLSSNYQKRFAIDGSLYWVYIGREDWKEWNYRISPRIRVNNKLFLIYDWEQSFSYNGQGYAVNSGISEPIEKPKDDIIFGNRNRFTTTNTFNIRYTINELMGITFRLRHYWSKVDYNFYYKLLDNGRLERISYKGLDADGKSAYNTNFNAFTIDMVYRWVFLPASEVNIVWKNAIFSTDREVALAYMSNLENIFEYGQSNSLSIKVIYWLDYLSLKKKSL